MEQEIREKLRVALAAELTEASVHHALGLVRKLLEHRARSLSLPYLRFCCDWAFHVRVDRAGASRMLGHFDDWSDTLIRNERAESDSCRFLLLFRFHLELTELLRIFSIPPISGERFCQFLRYYLEIIADCPASSGKDLGLRHVRELAIEREVAEAGRIYCWRVAFSTGETKRFPIDPSRFFDVRPTHEGEPWVWRGPVAAMVARPDGWLTDDQPHPDFQFSMYPVLFTRELAMKKSVFLYGKIVLKGGSLRTMEEIADYHELEVVRRFPKAEFERLVPLEGQPRGDGHYPRSILRVGNIDPSYGGPEYSLYLDSPKGVLLLVLICPEEEDERFLPILKWIGGSSLMMTRNEEPEAEAVCEVEGSSAAISERDRGTIDELSEPSGERASEFNRELDRRLSSLGRGEVIEPHAAREAIQLRSSEAKLIAPPGRN